MKSARVRPHVAAVVMQAGAFERQLRREHKRDADYLAGRFDEPDSDEENGPSTPVDRERRQLLSDAVLVALSSTADPDKAAQMLATAIRNVAALGHS